jgi:hypothetical protein
MSALLIALMDILAGVAQADSLSSRQILPLPGITVDRGTRWSDLSSSPRESRMSRGCPKIGAEDPTLDTIERVSGEEKGPRIAEPMVFDLVRPLGAKRGEGEVNVLGLVPFSNKSRRVDNVPDPLGLVRRSADRRGIEWAPEIEYAVCDGLAVEFELPMENAQLEAYKAAGQVTFGTAFDYRFIHGAQAIVQYDRHPSLWTTTLLYLAGFRFDETWSVFGMFGSRAEVVGGVQDKTVEMLANVTLFADVTDRVVAGIETNVSQAIDGNAEMLVMPQLHYEIDRHWMIQVGVGARFTTGLALPEAGFRLIREF